MSRISDNYYRDDGRLYNGYDYDKQVWVLNGKYQRCGHFDDMDCQCYGKEHAGEDTD